MPHIPSTGPLTAKQIALRLDAAYHAALVHHLTHGHDLRSARELAALAKTQAFAELCGLKGTSSRGGRS
jgi:hypothetical protein